MKRLISLIFILVAIALLQSCATTPAITNGEIKITDKNSNDYLIGYEDNSETKVFKALVDVKGKTYMCEVDYTAAAPDAMGFSLDVSAAELTGTVKFTYKTITVECAVKDDTLTPADKAEIKEAEKEISTEFPLNIPE